MGTEKGSSDGGYVAVNSETEVLSINRDKVHLPNTIMSITVEVLWWCYLETVSSRHSALLLDWRINLGGLLESL
jgi:hypothetical protein